MENDSGLRCCGKLGGSYSHHFSLPGYWLTVADDDVVRSNRVWRTSRGVFKILSADWRLRAICLSSGGQLHIYECSHLRRDETFPLPFYWNASFDFSFFHSSERERFFKFCE